MLCVLNEPAGFCLWQPKRIARFGARVVTQIRCSSCASLDQLFVRVISRSHHSGHSVSPQHCLALTTPESEAAAAREEAAGRMPNVPLQEKERLYVADDKREDRAMSLSPGMARC